MKNWRHSKEYKQWRKHIIHRDKHCKVCGIKKHLQAHHKNHAAYFLEDRYNVKKGICLCAKCHRHYHCDYHKSFREKCTEKDWENFMALVGYVYWFFQRQEQELFYR